jgi:hypothetical protein
MSLDNVYIPFKTSAVRGTGDAKHTALGTA